MVPAANSNNWLKSRLLRGSWLTDLLESSTPPVASCAAAKEETEIVPWAVSVSKTSAWDAAKSMGCEDSMQ